MAVCCASTSMSDMAAVLDHAAVQGKRASLPAQHRRGRRIYKIDEKR